MSYEDQPRTSSSGTVIAIVAVVVLLMLGGLLVLGLAGLFFFGLSVRSVAPPPPQMVERVMVQPAQPVELTPKLQAPTMAEAPPPGTDIRKIAVKLDPQGKILVDGQAVDPGGLKNLLVKTREDGAIHREVVVEVDRRCLFEHVAAVQAVCKEAGVENVRVQALTASPD
ncbi:MAG: biopolymer transporter ExbD [Planctomycetota bacterium]|nr:biopolymer transporter ExbD [Planctomycetota bacterium]